MSAIFGIINRDGRPLDAHMLATMQSVSAQWGRDSGGLWW
jgi:hypothetical protein